MMTQVGIEQLFLDNTKKISKLSLTFRTRIKCLLMGLASNGHVFIRLTDAAAKSNKISYNLIEGDQDSVVRIGERLRLTVTDTTLELRHA